MEVIVISPIGTGHVDSGQSQSPITTDLVHVDSESKWPRPRGNAVSLLILIHAKYNIFTKDLH